MNKRLLINSVSERFLPHQIATTDWILHKLDDNDTVLIFHKPGTGKTFIGILLSLIFDNKVIISAPNINILTIWETYLINYIDKISNVKMLSRLSLISIISSHINQEKIEDLDGQYIIIDEAHEILGSTLYELLLKLKETTKFKLILLSGTPVINTPKLFPKLLNLLSNDIQFSEDIINQNNSVINIKIKSEYIDKIKNILNDKVSFLDEQTEFVAKYNIIDLKLPMSDDQIKIYNDSKKNINNEMFQQVLNNVSLFGLNNIYKSETVSKLKDGDYIDGMKFKNYILVGNKFQPSNLIKYSSKIDYLYNFISNVKNKGKIFIYLSNPVYGLLILKSFFHMMSIEDKNDPTFFINPRCFCGKLKNSHKINSIDSNNYSIEYYVCDDGQLFSPMKYITLTGSSNLDPSFEIGEFNKESNLLGRECRILVGSDIISVGYTIKEIMSIHFITLPISKEDESQIIKRALRYKSHSNPSKVTVNVYRYISTIYNEESFDMKRLKYINLKSKNIETVELLLKEGCIIKDMEPHKLIIPLITRELVTLPSITESMKNPIIKKINIEYDKDILTKHIYKTINNKRYIISKDNNKEVILPLQNYANKFKILFNPRDYTIDEILIVYRHNNYYHTTDYKRFRNLKSISKEDLIELYKLYYKKIHKSESDNMFSIHDTLKKDIIIEYIISLVKGTKYLVLSKIDIIIN